MLIRGWEPPHSSRQEGAYVMPVDAPLVVGRLICRHNRGEMPTPGGVIYQDDFTVALEAQGL